MAVITVYGIRALKCRNMADWKNSIDHNFVIYLMCPS